MPVFNFSMHLSAEKCKRYYLGEIKSVVVTCDDGLTIQLPIERFRPFISSIGVRGRFRLTLDDNNKFVSLEQTHG